MRTAAHSDSMRSPEAAARRLECLAPVAGGCKLRSAHKSRRPIATHDAAPLAPLALLLLLLLLQLQSLLLLLLLQLLLRLLLLLPRTLLAEQ